MRSSRPVPSRPISARARANEALLAAVVVAVVAASLPAQNQFDELRRRGLPGVRELTRAVAIGDVDFDGDLDLALGNAGQKRLYINDGQGKYTDGTASRLPTDNDSTQAIVFGDVDGDADLDLVLGNDYPGQSRLYLNNAFGVFSDVTATNMPTLIDATTAVALGDVDGDGDRDIILGNYASQTRLYFNDGKGKFTDATTNRMPTFTDNTRALVLGDVDGDGDLDLVLGNYYYYGQQSRLYLNDGKGTFTDVTSARMPARREATRALALGDVDRDGDLDLVLGNYYYSGRQNRLYLNDGKGNFTDVTAARLPSVLDATYGVALGDIDGDLDLDLAVANSWNYGQQNRLYLNDGTGTFSEVTTTRLPACQDFTYAVVFGDVERDGDLDLVFANYYREQSRLYVNDGKGSFSNTDRLPASSDFTNDVAVGDVDRDGDLDLVLANYGYYGQQSRLFLNDGTGSYTDGTTARMPARTDGTRAVVLGDVDGDGDLDLVFGNYSFYGQQNRLYFNDGKGVFTDVTAGRMPAVNDSTHALVLGDVDGDGDLDLVVGNYGQDYLFVNDGKGNFSDVTAARMPTDGDTAGAVVLGDVDGDGDLDLVIGNHYYSYYGQQNRLYFNDGKGKFTDVTSSRMPTVSDATHALALGDVDFDGDLDLVVGNNGQNRLHLNDGKGTFTDVTASRLPTDSDWTNAVALGDVDGDADLDITLGNYYYFGRQNRLYLNDSKGVFTDGTAARMPVDRDATTSALLTDVDGDRDLDMVFGNAGQPRLYLNLHRHLHTPLLLRLGRNYTVEAFALSTPNRPAEIALPYVATASLVIPLPGLGTLRLDPAQMVPLPMIQIAASAGRGSFSATVPNNPSLVGTLYFQALHGPVLPSSYIGNMVADPITK